MEITLHTIVACSVTLAPSNVMTYIKLSVFRAVRFISSGNRSATCRRSSGCGAAAGGDEVDIDPAAVPRPVRLRHPPARFGYRSWQTRPHNDSRVTQMLCILTKYTPAPPRSTCNTDLRAETLLFRIVIMVVTSIWLVIGQKTAPSENRHVHLIAFRVVINNYCNRPYDPAARFRPPTSHVSLIYRF